VNSAGLQDSSRESRWTDQILDQMRQTGDPLGDTTVAAIFQEHGIEAVNSLWERIRQQNFISPEGLPPQIYSYLQQSSQLPSWADPKLIAQGERFFVDRGIFCLVSLLCASLPECYVLPNEAAVLATTGSLEVHAYRRVFETTQLIVDVMRNGGLRENGTGLQAAQKVRLMHAAIRHLILNAPGQNEVTTVPGSFPDIARKMPPWDVTQHGYPINQEHMAYTLLTFSHVVLRSFSKMKIEVAPEEAAAYLHCWNVVGYAMGVREDLLAMNLKEAECLFSTIRRRQFGQSADGTALADALVKAMDKIISREIMGWFSHATVQRFPPVIMRQLLDRDVIKILKIKPLTFFEWLMMIVLRILVVIFTWGYRKIIVFAGLRFGIHVLNSLTRIPPKWRASLFNIPDKLRQYINLGDA